MINAYWDAKGPFTQAMFATIFLLLKHAIRWIDLRMYIRPSVQSYTNQYFCDSIACFRMRKIATNIARVNGPQHILLACGDINAFLGFYKFKQLEFGK